MSTLDKQQFKNESGGHLGVVVIGPKGVETGIAVEPDGSVWLSREEQILTANAPRKAKDNPFIERTETRTDPLTGETGEYTYTPLVPVSGGDRFVPSDERYVPAALNDVQSTAAAQQAATGPRPATVVATSGTPESRAAEVEQIGDAAQPGQPAPVEAPPVPARAAAAAAAAQETPEVPVGATEPPTAPQETPEPVQTVTPPFTPTPTPDAATVAEGDTQKETVVEEHAIVDPAVGEETGAASAPVTPPAEGEYQASEEVGTPDAPTTPAPYTPPSE